MNLIGGVMVSVLANSAVDRGFEPRWDQMKDYEMEIKYQRQNVKMLKQLCIFHCN
jgi:hypothetical protein